MIFRFFCFAIFVFVLSDCDVLLHDVGNEGEPCLKNETCNEGGLVCYQGSCCKQSCEGKVCGDDGCGGSCGTCSDANEECDAAGKCICSFEDCNSVCCDQGQVCKEDSCCLFCGGVCCGVGYVCHNDSCCTPSNCNELGKECGTWPAGCDIDVQCDPCPGPTDYCTTEGQCLDDCEGRVCGSSPNAGHNCGSCGISTEYCSVNGSCIDDCDGRNCGLSPSQSFSCGTCLGATDFCNPNGLCEDDCEGRVCGPSPNILKDCGSCPGSKGWCNSDGQCVELLSWTTISGSGFMMGSNLGGEHALPVHQVTVPTFEMTATEVTVAQYEVCVNAGECSDPGTGSYCNWNVSGREDHPIDCVDWYQAVSFCQWVGGRLPSEAEWEYAARSGGQDVTYPWGNETATCDYCVMDDGGSGCGQYRTWAVCSKTAGNTDHGLCDMIGNVWEWVQDWYHESYDGAPTDGCAWEDPAGSDRVFRGGCWGNEYTTSLRASVRTSSPPGYSDGGIGFRCARDQ